VVANVVVVFLFVSTVVDLLVAVEVLVLYVVVVEYTVVVLLDSVVFFDVANVVLVLLLVENVVV
jgi:hypothetical protein